MRHQNITHERLAWKTLRPQSDGQLGRTLAVFEVVLSSSPPRRQRSRALNGSASAENSPMGRSVARAAITREPEGTWTTGVRLEDGSLQRTTGQVNASCTAFFL